MTSLELKGHKIEFFDSIESLPFKRMNEFNKYVIIDSHLGSTIFDFDKSLSKVTQFLQKNMVNETVQEIQNLRQVVFNILNGNDVKGLAFACMIKSIDGKEVTDFSQVNLNKILEKLSEWGLLGVQLLETLSEVKKK